MSPPGRGQQRALSSLRWKLLPALDHLQPPSSQALRASHGGSSVPAGPGGWGSAFLLPSESSSGQAALGKAVSLPFVFG